MGKKIPAQTVERGFAGTDESLYSEKGNDRLHGQHANERQDDLIALLENHPRVEVLLEGIGRRANQLAQIKREGQREHGGEQQSRHRGHEHRLFLHQIATDPLQGGFLGMALGVRHRRMGNHGRCGVNG